MALWLLVVISGIESAARADEVPVSVGSEFLVNTYTTDDQRFPSVDMAADGRFVVTWTSDGTSYGTGYSALIQRFGADGSPLGSELLVGSTPSYSGDVAIGPDDGIVVVWSEAGDIFGQLRDPNGVPLGGPFLVNSYTTGGQGDPSVGIDDSGRFVVIWTSDGSDTDPSFESVQAQRFDSNGIALGGQFQVNTYTDGFQWFASMDMEPNGNFVVAWMDSGNELDDFFGIRAQRFGSDGMRRGSELQVNTYTSDTQRNPSVALGPTGEFVVVWWTYDSDGSDPYLSVKGQFFSSSGAFLGGEFQANSYTTGGQVYPVATALGGSDFVVAWHNYDFSYLQSIQARRLSSTVGGVVGSEFQVSGATTLFVEATAVASSAKGDFVVAWQSFEHPDDPDRLGVFARRFQLAEVFADGFESGDTSAWTVTLN